MFGTPDAMAAAAMLALSSWSAEFEARPEVLRMMSSHERRRERVRDDESGVSADTIEAAVELDATANCASIADMTCCAVKGAPFLSRARAVELLLAVLASVAAADDDEAAVVWPLALMAERGRGPCFWSCSAKARWQTLLSAGPISVFLNSM